MDLFVDGSIGQWIDWSALSDTNAIAAEESSSLLEAMAGVSDALNKGMQRRQLVIIIGLQQQQ